MKKAILIYNPLSGARFIASKLNYIFEKFQEKNILIQPYILDVAKQSELINLIKSESYSFVIVAGGDGTVNFVANVLIMTELDIPLGVIPAGTCNDFAACINVPAKFEQSLDIILKGKVRQIDVGLLNKEKYFLNSYAGGVFADISFKTEDELKKSLGAFAYYIKALSEVKNIRSFNLRIKTDKEEIKEEAILFFISNGKNVAGLSNVIKKANISDGMMDIAIIKKCSHIDLVALFFKILNGTQESDSNVRLLRVKKCLIESDREIQITVDGEKGDPLPVVVEVKNKILKVFTK